MNAIDEPLLYAWLRMSTTLEDIQPYTRLTRNESLICHVLFRQEKTRPGVPLTPTDISRRTKIRKSQVNRSLNQLERRGIITREHSTADRRKVYVHFMTENASAFFEMYAKSIEMTDRFVSAVGADEAERLIAVMDKVTEIAESVYLGEDEQRGTGYLQV